MNTSITDTNSIEYYMKFVNNIYLNTVAVDLSLSSTDSSDLDEISDLSWIEAGDAFYQAAAMIGKEIHPSVISARLAQNNPEENNIKTEAQNSISVFPNPANDKIFVSGMQEGQSEIEIYDHLCRKIYERTCTENHCEIDISQLSTGIYHIRVKNNTKGFYKTEFAVLK